MQFEQFIKEAASVVPSPRQAAWFDTEFYAFVHFTVNTYTDLEWGLGNEDPNIFNPYDLDCDEWVRAVKSAGMKGIILTAKHHDGFCLWPSKYTEHCVKNSAWRNGKGDVVRECAEACKRGGIKFGVYCSPWDRNCPLYGTEEYNDYYCNQLEELLTGYGELFMVWFDGACGEGENGRKQRYDMQRYISLVRKYQPNAAIFNDRGPDVRWCGNEAGEARRAEWAVVPGELCPPAEVQTTPGPFADGATLPFINNPDPNVGEIHNILYSKGLCFCASEIDMSIRPGWFYHANEEPHSLERLVNTYLNSCGANTTWNLNIPPMPSGRFDPRDIARLAELGGALDDMFGEHKKAECKITEVACDNPRMAQYEITFDTPCEVAYIVLSEDLSVGQRIESFRIMNGNDAFANPHTCFHGFTVGHKKICKIGQGATKLDLIITSARDKVALKSIEVYKK